MSEALQDRAAKNQSLFREYNERLEQAKARDAARSPFSTWVCECAIESCAVPVLLTTEEYEAVRADPTHFLIAPSEDHLVPEVERVVRREERYWIVEKVGRAGETSERLEPDTRATSTGSGSNLENLARRYFALFNRRAFEKLREILHPDIVLELKVGDSDVVLQGRDEVMRFLEKESPRRMWEAIVQACQPLGDNCAVVAGRERWMDDERVLRDDPRLWALEFREGLLLRSVPVQTVSEAEAILSSPDQTSRTDPGRNAP